MGTGLSGRWATGRKCYARCSPGPPAESSASGKGVKAASNTKHKAPPSPRYNPCAATTCLTGTTCVVKKGVAVCKPEPYNPCAATLCITGTKCVVKKGVAMCKPLKATCSGKKCAKHKTCKVKVRRVGASRTRARA